MAGTANYHVGSLPGVRTLKVAKAHSIPIQHNARQFSKSDGQTFDYLIAMDKSNYDNMIEELGNESREHISYEGFLLQTDGVSYFDCMNFNAFNETIQ